MEDLKITAYENQSDKILEEIFDLQLSSEIDIITTSEEGVTKASVMAFIRFLKLSDEQFARLLPITLRTIQRYAKDHRFNPSVSEHIIQLVLLIGEGIDVFGSLERFMAWFNTPSQALAGKIPFNLVSLRTGIDMVSDEIGRIEYGVYA